MTSTTYSQFDESRNRSSSQISDRESSSNWSPIDVVAICAAAIMTLGPLAMAPAYTSGQGAIEPLTTPQTVQPATSPSKAILDQTPSNTAPAPAPVPR